MDKLIVYRNMVLDLFRLWGYLRKVIPEDLFRQWGYLRKVIPETRREYTKLDAPKKCTPFTSGKNIKYKIYL
jgi:hypothetical protein